MAVPKGGWALSKAKNRDYTEYCYRCSISDKYGSQYKMFTCLFCKQIGTVTCFSSTLSGSDLMFTAVHAKGRSVSAYKWNPTRASSRLDYNLSTTTP